MNEKTTGLGEAEGLNPEHVDLLTTAICSWFVRKDSKFYEIDNLTAKLSKDDVQRICLHRFGEEYPDLGLSRLTIGEVFRRAIDQKHAMPGQSIPVWNGGLICRPAEGSRVVWERGMVRVNTWKQPTYRLTDAQPALGVAGEFFDAIFTRDAEKIMFLDWLGWCLRNEEEKPTWAPFLYSATKGSGKSTLCELCIRLFGDNNATTQNNVDKLTSRFNLPILTRKLVVSEELHLRQESPQGNALKTYITETVTTSERKGQDAERIEQCCCFLFTSNHLPLWIEPEDRRYYLIDLDHDGHATGAKAREFSRLVERLKDDMRDDASMAALYLALIQRPLSEDFSAKTLNVVEHGTQLMKRVLGASEQTIISLLREYLAEKGLHAIPDRDAAEIVRNELGANPNSTRHLMSEIGWTNSKAKWDGCEFAKAVWTEKDYSVFRGNVVGPDGFEQSASEHFEKLGSFDF